ncbi:MAG: cell division protein FtsQ/DivIB [Syntrophomonadaceae bacterium]|jgi:cell division protein FtsQ
MSNKSRKKFSISILVLTLLVAVYLFVHSSFFNIEKVFITGLETVSTSEILALAGIKVGTNIFAVNEEVCTRSVQIHPMVKKATVIRHLPRKIEIKVTERKMWAVIPYNQSFLCIDDAGICMDKANNVNMENYPIITLATPPQHVIVGQAVAQAPTRMIRQVWNLLSSSARQQISEFHYINPQQGLVLFTVKGTEIKFGGLDRAKEKAELIDQILTMEQDFPTKYKTVLQYVDLRYDGQPVIKTKN